MQLLFLRFFALHLFIAGCARYEYKCKVSISGNTNATESFPGTVADTHSQHRVDHRVIQTSTSMPHTTIFSRSYNTGCCGGYYPRIPTRRPKVHSPEQGGSGRRNTSGLHRDCSSHKNYRKL